LIHAAVIIDEGAAAVAKFEAVVDLAEVGADVHLTSRASLTSPALCLGRVIQEFVYEGQCFPRLVTQFRLDHVLAEFGVVVGPVDGVGCRSQDFSGFDRPAILVLRGDGRFGDRFDLALQLLELVLVLVDRVFQFLPDQTLHFFRLDHQIHQFFLFLQLVLQLLLLNSVRGDQNTFDFLVTGLFFILMDLVEFGLELLLGEAVSQLLQLQHVVELVVEGLHLLLVCVD